jgi:hypothetical protein
MSEHLEVCVYLVHRTIVASRNGFLAHDEINIASICVNFAGDPAFAGPIFTHVFNGQGCSRIGCQWI